MSKENNDAGWRPCPRWTYEINFWKGIGLPAAVTCLLCEMPCGTRTYPDPLNVQSKKNSFLKTISLSHLQPQKFHIQKTPRCSRVGYTLIKGYIYRTALVYEGKLTKMFLKKWKNVDDIVIYAVFKQLCIIVIFLNSPEYTCCCFFINVVLYLKIKTNCRGAWQ